MKRHTLQGNSPWMGTDPNGSWVHYEDAMERIRKLERELEHERRMVRWMLKQLEDGE